jgi:hypothetical protein
MYCTIICSFLEISVIIVFTSSLEGNPVLCINSPQISVLVIATIEKFFDRREEITFSKNS